MVALDSSFLIDVLRGYPAAFEALDRLEQTEPVLFVPAPVAAELWEGAIRSGTTEEGGLMLDLLPVLPLDLASARRAAELRAELALNGRTIGVVDAMIAAIAMVNGKTLVTGDADLASIPELRGLKYQRSQTGA